MFEFEFEKIEFEGFEMKKINRRVVLGLGLLVTGFLSIWTLVEWNSDDEKLAKGKSVIASAPSEDESQKCVYQSTCEIPQLLFRIQTETDSSPPFACINDVKLFHDINIERGINVAVIDGKNGDVIDRKAFDVRASDEKLMRWIIKIPPAAVLVAASFGDVAEHVSTHARALFEAFGAKRIDEWRGGNAYAIIGQRGIEKGKAKEMIGALNENSNKIFEDCFELPLAETKSINLTIGALNFVHRADESKLAELGGVDEKKEVIYGREWKNCGLEQSCGDESISIFMFSGEHKDDHPKMCIGGKMLFDEDLNNAGRGLNIAMLEPKTGKVMALAHFDTYEDESKNLEEWLDSVPTGYIVAVVSFDEASNMLSEMARHIFYEMGSSMIDRLKFRASWYFIGQKGIGAYTPFEDLNTPASNSWAKPVKVSMCLPKSVYKWAGRKDLPTGTNDVRNLPKRHFCAKYDRHEEFCSDKNLDQPIVPKALKDETRVNEPIFNVPILVASGLSPDSLRVTLESLIQQEGLNAQMVLVTYDKEYQEYEELSTLFHMKSVGIRSNGSYNNHLLLSLSNVFSVFPEAKSVIVVEEDVKLSNDWLQYLSQIYEPLLADERIDFGLAFNPNGFLDLSGKAEDVLRIDGVLPIGSYILKRTLFEDHIRLREFCCTERGNWDLRDSTVLVPALSRIDITVDVLEKENPLFNRERKHSKNAVKLSREFVTAQEYSNYLEKIENKAKLINWEEVIEKGCENWKNKLSSKLTLIKYSTEEQVFEIFNCLKYYFTPRILKKNTVFRISIQNNREILIKKQR